MAAEVTMILIDNSYHVPVDSDVFKTQLEAIRLYCRAKIKSNPKFCLGLATMGRGAFNFPTPPTSDVELFLTHTLEHITWGGELSVPRALQVSEIGIGFKDFPKDTKRRMLVFFAGPIHIYILKTGKRLKEMNIALDVVCFAHEEDPEYDATRKKNLKLFVDVANKGNNSHFAHVPCRSSPRTFLVSSKILSPKEAALPLTEEGINKKMNTKKKSKRNRTKKKKNHLSQDQEKHSQEDVGEEAVSSSCRAVIFPEVSLQVAEKYKSLLVFGSVEMHKLINVPRRRKELVVQRPSLLLICLCVSLLLNCILLARVLFSFWKINTVIL